MKTRVVTLMWGSAWERYGALFASSFAANWPEDVDLVIVSDRELPDSVKRARRIPLFAVDGLEGFRARWSANRRAQGFDPPEGSKVDQFGYSWKHDALKWMPQALAPRVALEGLADEDILVWLDGDVEATARVPEGWVEELLGGNDIALLQRAGTHSEIGFIGFRVNVRTRALIAEFAALYTTGLVFTLREWHSAFVFDRALERVPGLRIRNLNPGGKGHVWPTSPLARCTVHHKGKRKDRR